MKLEIHMQICSMSVASLVVPLIMNFWKVNCALWHMSILLLCQVWQEEDVEHARQDQRVTENKLSSHSLTSEQRSVYRAFLVSAEVEQIFNGNRNSLHGIDVMGKICNHPDLLEREHSYGNPDYGNPEHSGKMKVIAEVLKVWKHQGHRVLLFAQSQQMLDILESFIISCCYTYRRMDGMIPVKQRMTLIDEFNNSDELFIFILTTKVGGLGTNLTGANMVIIFDPDWNPSTDMQVQLLNNSISYYRLTENGTMLLVSWCHDHVASSS